MIQFVPAATLKQKASAALKGRWGVAIIATFLFNLITGSGVTLQVKDSTQNVSEQLQNALQGLETDPTTYVSSVTIIFLIICLLIQGPMNVGCDGLFLKIADGKEASVGNLFNGFKNFGANFVLGLISSIFLALWTCLFIIPGVIKGFSYSMIYYIRNDQPELSATETITKSRRLMKGYKWKLFCLRLSFIGWDILSIFTLGILEILYVQPKVNAAKAEFYNYYIRPRLNEAI